MDYDYSYEYYNSSMPYDYNMTKNSTMDYDYDYNYNMTEEFEDYSDEIDEPKMYAPADYGMTGWNEDKFCGGITEENTDELALA